MSKDNFFWTSNILDENLFSMSSGASESASEQISTVECKMSTMEQGNEWMIQAYKWMDKQVTQVSARWFLVVLNNSEQQAWWRIDAFHYHLTIHYSTSLDSKIFEPYVWAPRSFKLKKERVKIAFDGKFYGNMADTLGLMRVTVNEIKLDAR